MQLRGGNMLIHFLHMHFHIGMSSGHSRAGVSKCVWASHMKQCSVDLNCGYPLTYNKC